MMLHSDHQEGHSRRLLIVDDDPDVARLLIEHLSELPAEVCWSDDGERGLEIALREGPWDAVVLDLRLPGMHGIDVCRALRAQGFQSPILMLTAKSAEIDRIVGLEIGADDYLVKPFSVLELQARIRARLRRIDAARSREQALAKHTAQEVQHDALNIGALRIDKVQRRVWENEAEVALTSREFGLLWHFARRPGRAFSRADLLAGVWGYGHEGYEHTVNTHINRLRNKLGGQYIHTVWGVGYRFEAPA